MSSNSTRSAPSTGRTTRITTCAVLLGGRQPPHPDTITRRFKKLAAAAVPPEIDLHDVRHSYATAGRDAKIDWKALGRRIGRPDVAFAMKQYVQTDLEADRQVANTLAALILGGALSSTEVTGGANLAAPGHADITAGGEPARRHDLDRAYVQFTHRAAVQGPRA